MLLVTVSLVSVIIDIISYRQCKWVIDILSVIKYFTFTDFTSEALPSGPVKSKETSGFSFTEGVQ